MYNIDHKTGKRNLDQELTMSQHLTLNQENPREIINLTLTFTSACLVTGHKKALSKLPRNLCKQCEYLDNEKLWMCRWNWKIKMFIKDIPLSFNMSLAPCCDVTLCSKITNSYEKMIHGVRPISNLSFAIH